MYVLGELLCQGSLKLKRQSYACHLVCNKALLSNCGLQFIKFNLPLFLIWHNASFYFEDIKFWWCFGIITQAPSCRFLFFLFFPLVQCTLYNFFPACSLGFVEFILFSSWLVCLLWYLILACCVRDLHTCICSAGPEVCMLFHCFPQSPLTRLWIQYENEIIIIACMQHMGSEKMSQSTK